MQSRKRTSLLPRTNRTVKASRLHNRSYHRILSLLLVVTGLLGLIYAGILQLIPGSLTPAAEQLLQQSERPMNERREQEESNGFYSLGAMEDVDGQVQNLSQYKGNVSIVVNVASYCGYTDSNYKGKSLHKEGILHVVSSSSGSGLQMLFDKYKEQGFTVLAFPCNQFGKQEPGTCDQIHAFVTQKYNVTFPVFSKIDVNGPETHPVYKFLKSHLPDADKRGGPEFAIRWNFEKFLVDCSGMPVALFPSAFTLKNIEPVVVSLLNSKSSS